MSQRSGRVFAWNMSGPYEMLHIYEVEGILEHIPDLWRSKGFLGAWEDGGYTFLFFSSESRDLIQESLSEVGTSKVRSETVIPYEDWEAGTWLKPFEVGPLVFAPPWDAAHIQDPIIVDPGVSFGSGFHGSTRACLELLVRLYQMQKPRIVLDLGTGSGILALAAARLGAEMVLAVDNQPAALEKAVENVASNRMGEKVQVRRGDVLELVEEPAHLVTANLHLDLLLELVRRPALWEKTWCIVSGLIGRQAEVFLKSLGSTPMQLLESRREGPWSAFLLYAASQQERSQLEACNPRA